MTQNDLKLLVMHLTALSQETEWVEFKVNNADPVKIGQYISALANSALLHGKPSGYLVFGIEDETHKVVGTTFRPKSEKKGNEPLEQWLNSMIKPKVRVQIFEFRYEEKDLAIFKIKAAPNRPVAFREISYIRIGSVTRKLSEFPNLEQKLWERGKALPFEREIAATAIPKDQLDDWLSISNYFQLLNKQMPEHLDGQLAQFVSEKFLYENEGTFDITNLGAILFAKDLSKFEFLGRKAIRVIVYAGNNRIDAVVEQVGHYGYCVKFEGLIEWINEQLPMNEVIGAALRKQVKMYPESAIRELVANALIHQDFYETGTGVMVEIFSDRIEITNPGKPLIDTLRFMDEPPQSRNEILASFMRRVGICEERGSGIDRVVSNCEVFQLPAPSFEAKRNHLRASLFAYMKTNEMEKEDRIRSCYLHCCLKFVQNEQLTNESLRERFQIKKQNHAIASRIIKETIEANLIKPKDPASNSKKYRSYIPFWA